MITANDEWQSKFDEYNAAGEFDYLKSLAFECGESGLRIDLDVSLRTYNILTLANVQSLFDLIGLDAMDLPKFKGLGKKTYTEVAAILAENRAFVRSGNPASFHHSWQKSIRIPTFQDLYNRGELDAYLAKGKALADEKDPEWRKRISPASSQPTATALPQPAVDEKLEEFIRNKAQTDFTDQQREQLMMPLWELNLPEDAQLKQLSNEDGSLILAEFVYSGRELLTEKGYAPDVIDVITKEVQELGFMGIDFRKNAEDAYHQNQMQDKINKKITEKQEEYKAKFGF